MLKKGEGAQRNISQNEKTYFNFGLESCHKIN